MSNCKSKLVLLKRSIGCGPCGGLAFSTLPKTLLLLFNYHFIIIIIIIVIFFFYIYYDERDDDDFIFLTIITINNTITCMEDDSL